MHDFRLHIVTQQETVFDEAVTSIVLPGEDGSLGIMAHHAPIISILKAGPVHVTAGGKQRTFQITGGFVEMHSNVATLLADSLTGL